MGIRTDLAQDIVDRVGKLEKLNADWVDTSTENMQGVTLYTVKIKSNQGETLIGKPKGEYVTAIFDVPFATAPQEEQVITFLGDKLKTMLPPKGSVLVVCLGNENITPDALGPLAAQKLLATRHIDLDLQKQIGLSFRPVAVLAPGVLGQTGLEVQEIIKGVLKSAHFDLVVAIDALACESTSRLGCTLQISNTGICPGSGVQNARAELSFETLGVPVFSMGVPTVVDMDKKVSTYMVTPREIDQLIDRASAVVAKVLNLALQPTLSPEEVDALVS